MENYNARLKSLRARAGLSQQSMASALGLTRAGYQMIENGRNGKKFAYLPMIAKTLGCRIDDLFPEMDEQREEEAEAKPHARAVLTAEETEGDFPDGWAM